MTYNYQNFGLDESDDENIHARWAQEHDLKIIWKCFCCGFGYFYESEPMVNEALSCPHCGNPTENAGESYK